MSEGFSCTMKLCELAKAAGLAPGFNATSTSNADKVLVARKLVAQVADMNAEMAIPTEVKEMKATDVDEVARRALNETNGESFSLLKKPVAAMLDLGYAVPKYMTSDDCKRIVAQFLPAEERQKWIAMN